MSEIPNAPTAKRAAISTSSPKAEFPPSLTRTIQPPVFVPETKPGWYTSEFWLTALIIIGVFVSLILGRITVDDIANLWPLIAGPAAYALSRGLAKKA